MQFSHSPATLQTWTGSVLAVGVLEGDPQGVVAQLETRFERKITPWLEQRKFRGKTGEVASLQLLTSGLSSLVIVGVGAADGVSLPVLRLAAASATKASLGNGDSLGMLLPWGELGVEGATAVAEAVRLASFKDQRFRSEQESQELPERVELLGALPAETNSALALSLIHI